MPGQSRPLEGKVALVTGASKNIGKGLALEVAAAGAVTYLTARTLEDAPGTLGSLRRTAAEIEAAGGQAIPLACDHTEDAQVEAVFERIRVDAGRLDLLVNVASPNFAEMVGLPFWEIPFHHMSACLDVGPRSNFVTTALAARIMVPQGSGLVVNISSHGATTHLLSVPYGIGKGAIDKLTRDAAAELRAHQVAVVSLWPGLVLTEFMLGQVVTAPDGSQTLHGLDTRIGETPKFNGKAIVALATDPQIMARSGGSFKTSVLAREYGFTEDDGHLPPVVSGLQSVMPPDEIPEFWRGVDRFDRETGIAHA